MESKGNIYRIKQGLFDLLSLEDSIVDDIDDECSWGLIDQKLRLKSTFLYYDLSQVILSAKDEQLKETITLLANQLFRHLEEFHDAVKSQSITMARSCYTGIVTAIQEVIAALLPAKECSLRTFKHVFMLKSE